MSKDDSEPMTTEESKYCESNYEYKNNGDNRVKTVTLMGVTLRLARPDIIPLSWVGQDEMIKQVLACWSQTTEDDLPMHPRIIGKPGVGKTTLAYAAGERLKRPVYLFQATMDTRPEDLLISPVIGPDSNIIYSASSLVTAMITGGVIILDEGNRMSEKSWASLAPLLDNRRYIESIVAGVKIQAHPDFRFCATMNDDSSTFEIPEYIHSRLQPQLFLDFPDADEEMLILKKNLPFASNAQLKYVVDFLQKAHAVEEMFTIRDGINIARYALKLVKLNEIPYKDTLKIAIRHILGKEALTYLGRATKRSKFTGPRIID